MYRYGAAIPSARPDVTSDAALVSHGQRTASRLPLAALGAGRGEQTGLRAPWARRAGGPYPAAAAVQPAPAQPRFRQFESRGSGVVTSARAARSEARATAPPMGQAEGPQAASAKALAGGGRASRRGRGCRGKSRPAWGGRYGRRGPCRGLGRLRDRGLLWPGGRMARVANASGPSPPHRVLRPRRECWGPAAGRRGRPRRGPGQLGPSERAGPLRASPLRGRS